MNERKLIKWPRRRTVCLSIVTSLMAGACATPYQEGGSRKGYSDFRITDDSFAVTFRANSATREETVDKYILRRASELALKHGYKYFVIVGEKARTRSSSIGYSGLKFPIVIPGQTIKIRCFREIPPDDQAPIDAAEFMRYNFPEALEKRQATTD